MREIKFRAWDERGNKMYQVKDLGVGKSSWEKTAVNYDEQPKTGYCKFYPGEVEVMQYTGLKDKNGKEIYEGDIVEVSEEGRMLFGSRKHLTRKYSLIGFHDGAFMLGRNKIDFSRMDTYLYVMKDYISVVGNIYENKNLLEKENKDESSK